jgi:hypothetical protein
LKTPPQSVQLMLAAEFDEGVGVAAGELQEHATAEIVTSTRTFAM